MQTHTHTQMHVQGVHPDHSLYYLQVSCKHAAGQFVCAFINDGSEALSRYVED